MPVEGSQHMVLLDNGKTPKVRLDSLDLHVHALEPSTKKAKTTSAITIPEGLNKIKLNYPSNISFHKSRLNMFRLISKSIT